MQMKIKDNLDSIWLCEMADISCVLKLNPMLLCSFYTRNIATSNIWSIYWQRFLYCFNS